MTDIHEPGASTPPENPTSEPLVMIDLDKYQAVYGRIFLAALSDGTDLQSLINPGKQLGESEINNDSRQARANSGMGERKYNPILNGLSERERTDAWRGVDFDDAYNNWSDSLRSSIHLSTTDTRKDVIRLFTGKENSDVTPEDIKTLYDKYCKNGSNVDAFVKKALENLGSIEDVEWLARRLFGRYSANIVSRIVEIEYVYNETIDGQTQNSWLFSGDENLTRLNNLTTEEHNILNLLSMTYEEPSVPRSRRGERTQRGDRDRRGGSRDDHGSRNPSGDNRADSSRPPSSPGSTQETNQQSQRQTAPARTPAQNRETSSQTREDRRIRSGMIVTNSSGEKFYIQVDSPPPLSILINAAINEVEKGNEVIDPLTNLPLELPKDEALAYLRDKLNQARESEASGKSIRDDDVPIRVIRISDGETEEMTKGDLWKMWKGKDQKYIRNPLERKTFRLPDGKVYILQTFYDKNERKESARFYVNENDSGNKYVQRLTMTMDEFTQLLDSGEIKTADGLPISTTSTHTDEVLPGTFMADGIPQFGKESMPTVGQRFTVHSGGVTGGNVEVLGIDPDFKYGPRVKVKTSDGNNVFWPLDKLNEELRNGRIVYEIPTEIDSSADPSATETDLDSSTPGVPASTPSPAPALPVEPEAPKAPSVITLESSGRDFSRDLNGKLSTSTDNTANISVPVGTLREFLMSFGGGKVKNPGQINIGGDNQIIVSGLHIDGGMMGGQIKLDLVLRNTPSGIEAQITRYDGRGGPVRGNVEGQIAQVNSNFQNMLNEQIARANPSWRSTNLSIAGDRVKMSFAKKS